MRLSVAILLFALACGDDMAAAPPDAGADAAPAGQGSQATGDLVVNEVAPAGDWVELLNRSGRELDLCDYLLTDSMDRLDHYLALGGAAPPEPCAPRPMAAGAYLVIETDDGAAPGHAPFKLAMADEVHVALWSGQVVDGLLYIMLGEADQSLARRPDGEGLFHAGEPSRGQVNP